MVHADPFKQERKKTAAISITVEPKSQSKKRNLSTTTKTDKGSSGRSRSKSAGPPKSRSSPTGTPRKVAKRTGGKGGKQVSDIICMPGIMHAARMRSCAPVMHAVGLQPCVLDAQHTWILFYRMHDIAKFCTQQQHGLSCMLL